jgi:hypothetical protein
MEIQLCDESRDQLESLVTIFDKPHSDVLDLAITVLAAMALHLKDGKSITVSMDDERVSWQ